MFRTIDIDIDNTLFDLTTPWFAAYNQAYQDTLRLDDCETWDTHLYCKAGTKIYDFLTPELSRHIEPLPGAVEATHRLSRRYTLRALTATSAENLVTKAPRVFAYFPWITAVQSIGDRPKSDISPEFLIDDGAHHFTDGTFPGILLDYRHNRNSQLRTNVLRVKGPNYWENILKLFFEKGWL